MRAETRSSSNGGTSAVLLESWLRQRLGSRIPELTVESNDGQLVVCGRVNTYYALQLTLAAVTNVLQETNGELPREVSVAVRVGDVARELQFVCRKHRNGEL
jgi:hypothetical protein